MTTLPLLKESLFLLNFTGLNPLNNSIRSKIGRIMMVLIFGIFVADVFLQLVFGWKGLESLDAVSGFVGGYQVFVKVLALVLNREKLAVVLRTMNGHFWKLNKYGSKFERETLKIYKIIKLVMLITAAFYVITGTAYHTKPGLSNPKILPLDVYFPFDTNNPFNYAVVYFWEVSMLVLAVLPSLLGFDFLFISLTVHLIVELKLLRVGFAALSANTKAKKEEKLFNELNLLVDQRREEEDLSSKLNLLINHHNLVLCCIKNVKECYSVVLLNQFLTTVCIVASSLLNIIIIGFPPDLTELTKPAPYLASYMSVMFIYCFGGTLLTTEGQGVADSAYETDWWVKTQPEVRRQVVLIIQRAQKEEKLTAAGMFDLDLVNFSNVSMSIHSLSETPSNN